MRYLYQKLLLWLVAAMFVPSLAHAYQFKILVLAMPDEYHYEFIPLARDSFHSLSKLHKFDVEWTNQPSAFEGDLSQYAAIVMMNTAGDVLNETQRKAYEGYMQAGGNSVVVHRGIVMPEGEWPWYEKLVGRSFTVHPLMQTAIISSASVKFFKSRCIASVPGV